jgi:hypothetical protein
VKRTLTTRDARMLARIINLADRCGCLCTLLSAEHHGDMSHYQVSIELQGSDEALRLLESQLDRILAYERELSA